MMGQIFEELLRKFSEMSNETSGEHYNDVVRLLISLVFSEDKKNLEGDGIVRVYLKTAVVVEESDGWKGMDQREHRGYQLRLVVENQSRLLLCVSRI